MNKPSTTGLHDKNGKMLLLFYTATTPIFNSFEDEMVKLTISKLIFNGFIILQWSLIRKIRDTRLNLETSVPSYVSFHTTFVHHLSLMIVTMQLKASSINTQHQNLYGVFCVPRKYFW